MSYIVASFRSRAESIGFFHLLTNNGINAQIINTPKEANIGCGLSVKFSYNNLPSAKNILSRVNTNSFVGFFSIKIVGNKKFVYKV